MEEIIRISAYNEGGQTQHLKIIHLLISLSGEGGLKSSRLINKHLIDYFVPFLPLERRHVQMCFKDYLRSRNVNYSQEQLERLADSIPVRKKFKFHIKRIYFWHSNFVFIALVNAIFGRNHFHFQFFPKDTPIYSLSGCKQVVQRADFILVDLIRELQLSHHHSDEV